MTLSRRILPLAGIIVTAGFVWMAMSFAQAAQKAAPAEGKPGWSTHCSGASRSKELDCAIEERAVMSQTGQLMASFTIRLPQDTHKPVMMVQTPVGLYLPAGLSLDVDGDAAEKYQLQTCDLSGCYAGSAVSDKLLDAMKDGKTLSIKFQNVARKEIVVPLPLAGFKEAYSKIE